MLDTVEQTAGALLPSPCAAGAAAHVPRGVDRSQRRALSMPLVRSQDDFKILQFERVDFWMEAGEKRVLCKVGYMALSERAFHDGVYLRQGPAFTLYRDEVERIASEKYDRGQITKHGSVVIMDYDLVPHLAGTARSS
jgi:hypothetical protein